VAGREHDRERRTIFWSQGLLRLLRSQVVGVVDLGNDLAGIRALTITVRE
jgi:hypothetical protein